MESEPGYLYDALTGYYNRKCLNRLYLEQKALCSGKKLFFVLVHINNLELIRDKLGQARCRDIVLKASRILSDAVSTLQVVKVQYTRGQYLFLIRADINAQTKEIISYIAGDRNIRDLLNNREYREHGAGLKLGISDFPSCGDSLHSLLILMEEALSRAIKNQDVVAVIAKKGGAPAKTPELDRLLSVINRLDNKVSDKQVILLEEEGASGKSIYLDRLPDFIEGRDTVHLKRSATHFDLEYYMIFSMVQKLLNNKRYKAPLLSIVGRYVTEIDGLLSGGIRYHGDSEGILSGTEKTVFEDKIRRFLHNSNLLMIVEDAHFADRQSLAILEDVIKRPGSGLYCVLTSDYRNSAAMSHFLRFKTVLYNKIEKVFLERPDATRQFPDLSGAKSDFDSDLQAEFESIKQWEITPATGHVDSGNSSAGLIQKDQVKDSGQANEDGLKSAVPETAPAAPLAGSRKTAIEDRIYRLCRSEEFGVIAEIIRDFGFPDVRDVLAEMIRGDIKRRDKRLLLELVIDEKIAGLEREINDLMALSGDSCLKVLCINYLTMYPYRNSIENFKEIIGKRGGIFRKYAYSPEARVGAFIALSKFNDRELDEYIMSHIDSVDYEVGYYIRSLLMSPDRHPDPASR